jgi:hypothetical protein
VNQHEINVMKAKLHLYQATTFAACCVALLLFLGV